jgi:ubiquinone/menaquinone biosynthesis C-methylase UbiE
MSFKDHFSDQSAAYREYRPQYPKALYAYLAQQVEARDLAWDCATGNGQAAHGLTRYFSRVIATDASESQIENALPDPHIHYQVCPAEHASLANQSTDLITVAQALHWFDLDAFAEEVHRVLKPNGLLAVWTYNLMSVNPEIDRVIEHLYRQTLDTYWPPERIIVENNYRSIHFPDYLQEMETPQFSMQTDWTLEQLLGYLKTWSAVKRYQQATEENPVEAVKRAFISAWGNNEQVRTVSWPLSLRLWQKVT